MADTGTPAGSSQAGSRLGQLTSGEQNLELGWAAGLDTCNTRIHLSLSLNQDQTLVGLHGLPLQSVQLLGLSPIPSHHTPPSSVMATLVKIVSLKMVAMAIGLL